MLAGGKASRSTEPELNQLYPLGMYTTIAATNKSGQQDRVTVA